MLRAKNLFVFTLLVSTQLIWVATADAGPLLDWIRGRRVSRQATPPLPGAAPCGQPNACATGSCTTTCMQTCQRVVVNYVPCTAYRSSWDRVPVTTYRQTTSTDPCSGCTVTCNRPCTTYTYRMKQVPYTTYRPVYRTETYQVPVTYTTPAPAAKPSCGLFSGCNLFNSSRPTSVQSVPVQAVPMGAPMAAPMAAQGGGCNSCASPSLPMMQPQASNMNTPTYYEASPNTIATPPSSNLPADQIPTLANPQNMQKPIIEGTSSTTTWPAPNANPATQYNAIPDPIPSNRWDTGNGNPSLVDPFNQSASAPSVQRWDYSPVKLASYEDPLKVPVALQERPNEYVGTISVVSEPRQPSQRLNEGWRTD